MPEPSPAGPGRAGPTPRSGFSFVEAILSLVVLTFIASVVGTVYFSGLQAYEVQAEQVLISSQLRSKMEYLLSTSFSTLASGSQSVTLNGKSYTLTWTVTNEDMNGDGAPEATAKKIEITLGNRNLATLVTNTTDKVFKL